jgi:hypothetical protein
MVPVYQAMTTVKEDRGMETATNPWCDALGIPPPDLAAISPEVLRNNFALLIAALLERGAAMTLVEVATRAAEAGLGDRLSILIALERCRPGRAPVFRDGPRYALDPRDPECSFWPMRLGLDPRQHTPRAPRAVEPTPADDVALRPEELAEAWPRATASAWSGQRIALAVLDAHGRAMTPAEIEAFVRPVGPYLPRMEGGVHTARGGPLAMTPEGALCLTPEAEGLIRSARGAVRAVLQKTREAQAQRISPEELTASRAAWAAKQAAKGALLRARRHAVLAAFPRDAPEAVAVVDVEAHTCALTLHPKAGEVAAMLDGFDALCGLDVREQLRVLGVEVGTRRVLELGATQKGRTLNRAGRTLRITPAMLIQSSCGIARPLGEGTKLRGYVREAQWAKLARRVEADGKSLAAMFTYGRLHGAMRLRWGFLDEWVSTNWTEFDDPHRLQALKRDAHAQGRPLEVVLHTAAWEAPWSRAREVTPRDLGGSTLALLDDDTGVVCEADIVAARIKA